jgi:hypothetical protein
MQKVSGRDFKTGMQEASAPVVYQIEPVAKFKGIHEASGHDFKRGMHEASGRDLKTGMQEASGPVFYQIEPVAKFKGMHEASGHDFSRAVSALNERGFSPCRDLSIVIRNSERQFCNDLSAFGSKIPGAQSRDPGDLC